MDPIVTLLCESSGPHPAELAGIGGALRQVFIKAGHVAERHSHPHEQFLYVVSGAGRLAHEDGVVPLQPGLSLHLPAQAWHSAEFTADTVLLEFNLAAD